MKGTGAKRNVCPGSCVSTGAKFPVAPVESATMCIALVLRLGHATGSVYWYGHAEVCGSGLLRHSLNFSTAWCTMRLSVSTRLEACINAEGGYSEHLLWRCMPDIPVATHHNRFFSEPSKTIHNWLSSEFRRLKERNKLSVRWKSFAFHKLVWWHFQVG